MSLSAIHDLLLPYVVRALLLRREQEPWGAIGHAAGEPGRAPEHGSKGRGQFCCLSIQNFL